MTKVVIADQLHPDANSILTEAGLDVIDISNNKNELFANIKDAHAIIVRSATKVTKELLDFAPNLRIIGRAGVGLDNVDLEECKKRQIVVVNSPEGPTQSVAEITLGLIIALSRKLIILDKETKKGNWPKKMKGHEIHGKTLGIIGSGAIGGTLAKYCIAMGMRVIAYDIVKIAELEKLNGFEYVQLDELFSNADVISIHVPLVKATKHMINQSSIAKMKDGVIIVNAARGGVIDENSVFEPLKNGKIAGLALDVYESEPVTADHKLFELENVIATPHIGAQTHEANRKNTSIVCDKLISFFAN
ncbi:MAG: (S)-sulfolactate dehydrogenase [Candidatus Heimdallarchaeota archaeon LC_2]|nr:MAG: (S)-sulfolactate dehydrogenase [Candidatus Heimdallarchaeota archaeon LC_2]